MSIPLPKQFLNVTLLAYIPTFTMYFLQEVARNILMLRLRKT